MPTFKVKWEIDKMKANMSRFSYLVDSSENQCLLAKAAFKYLL